MPSKGPDDPVDRRLQRINRKRGTKANRKWLSSQQEKGLKTEKDDYKLRIVVGSTFEDITEDLTLIDLPINTKENN